ncbi:MAG: methyl-accepting chemotaxis protein [Pseudomonadota bacterium]
MHLNKILPHRGIDGLHGASIPAERIVIAAIWIHAPVFLVICWAIGRDLLSVGMIAAGLSVLTGILAEVDWRLSPKRARITIALAAITQPAILTGLFSGHPWQVEMHMYFFAVMAALSVLNDIRAVMAATALVALHHLSLNYIMPSLVYPGGTDLGRTLVHAVILVFEAAALCYMINDRQRQTALAAGAESKARAAASEAQEAKVRILQAEEDTLAERQRTMALMTEAFGDVVEGAVAGDLGRRIDHDFEDPEMAALAGGVNRLLDGICDAIGETQRVLKGFAQGDLSMRVEGDFQGSFASLQADANAMGKKLQDLVSQIGDAAERVRASATTITDGSRSLSQRTDEQASALQQTSATMTQMARSVHANADNTRSADRLSQDVAESAKKGGEVAERAIQAVQHAADSASKISDVTALVDGIAFQTNLLALNAAVEAARAGSAGQGFAVVAQEVRTLAQRAGNAAGEIRELIGQSTAEVSESVDLITSTGATLSDVDEGIRRMTLAIGEIAASGRDQAAGVDEIEGTLKALDTQTQQNAALASDSTTTAADLIEQAEALSALVDFFRTGDESLNGQITAGQTRAA